MLERAAGRYGYIDYERAWETMRDLEEFLCDMAGQLLKSGHVWEAFSLTGYGFQAAAGCEMDGLDGGLTMLFEGCRDLWRAQIGAASPEQKRDMYQWFQKTGQAAPGLKEEFLQEAQQTLFQAPEFLRENIRELDQMDDTGGTGQGR